MWHYSVSGLTPGTVDKFALGFSRLIDILDPASLTGVPELAGTRLEIPASGDVQFVYAPTLSVESDSLEVRFGAPSTDDAFTPITVLLVDTGGVRQSPVFSTAEDGIANTVQVLPGPAASLVQTTRSAGNAKAVLPYASELFGVYQPLLGWRSSLSQARLSDATASRFNAAAKLIANDIKPNALTSVGTIAPRVAFNRIGTQIAQQLASHVAEIPPDGKPTEWHTLLSASHGSVLSSITTKVISGIHATSSAAPSRVTDTFSDRPAAENEAAIARRVDQEAASASLLHYLGQKAPNVIDQLFRPAQAPWQRALAGAILYSDPHPAKSAFLSPIGILHSFREYFFELGTFLGPPVGHVWLSPGGTVELVEVNTRRVLVERVTERSIETTTKSEASQTDKDDLSDAIKTENANDTKFGVTASASGGVSGVWQASGSASFNLDTSRKQAQEQTHKRMREQSSKLSSEVRQNYKTTFRTTTETTDTSSRRYLLQNTSTRLVSYELSRKMRKVAVQVQDLGQQLCWQLYIDNPGDVLGLGEFVHDTSSALDPGVKQPNKLPYPAPQEKTFSASVPFLLLHGGDDGAEDTYERSSENADHGIFKPDAGKNDIIQFRFNFKAPAAADGYVLSSIRTIDFHGAQVAYTIDGLGTNPDPATGVFSFCLTHANFGGAHALPFDAILVYDVTKGARDAVDAANVKTTKEYDDDVALKREQNFFETLRNRLKLTGEVRPRPQDDLREEERNITFRRIVSRLYGSEKGWETADYHVAAELIRYFFDVDAMMYFVAPDWWRPRSQALVSKNNQGEIQPTIIADSALSNRAGFGRVPVPGSYRPNYLITEKTSPAPLGASLGWLIQLDGDAHRNAFLNSPWLKAVLPIRPGRERDAIAWLRRPEVADGDGLNEPYPFNSAVDPPEYSGLTIEKVLLKIADRIASEYKKSLTPIAVNPSEVNGDVALPAEVVYSHGFDPLEGGIKFGSDAFSIFSQWIEVLPTDQVVATEYSLTGLP